MARLIYSAITPIDGYIEDAAGRFGSGVPDEEAHASSTTSRAGRRDLLSGPGRDIGVWCASCWSRSSAESERNVVIDE